MMYAIRAGVAAGLLGLGLGCTQAPDRLNAPPQGAAARQPSISQYYDGMSDQALLADRCIRDSHFIPHTAEVNGTGVARLQRYAELLANHGGTLAYSTSLEDTGLINARIAAAREILAETTPGGELIEVAVGLPGGRGLAANEAMIRNRALQRPVRPLSGGSGGSMSSQDGQQSPGSAAQEPARE